MKTRNLQTCSRYFQKDTDTDTFLQKYLDTYTDTFLQMHLDTETRKILSV